MTLPFVRARWSKKLPEATESSTAVEIICVQRFQQKPGDTPIHELRLVVRRSNEARQISPYVLCRGNRMRLYFEVDFDAVTLTSRPVLGTLTSRNFNGPRLACRLRREKIHRL
jgi:hypothetical protein